MTRLASIAGLRALWPRRRRPMTSTAVRLGSYPHPFPDGWYRLLDSDALRPGAVHYVECLGRQFVLWRGERTRRVHALRAFCPHMGANLGGGRVAGECIECPFHGWQFSGAGRAEHVPYSDSPPAVRAESFPVQEVHGQVLVYCRAGADFQSAADTTPYPAPRTPEVDSGEFAFRGAWDAGRIRMHLIEFAENAVDNAHFPHLHGSVRLPWTGVRVPGLNIEHTAHAEFDAERPWMMYFHDDAVLGAGGRRFGGTSGHARITFTGPGSVVAFRFTVPGRGEIEMLQTHLPVAPLEQQVNFHWFASRRLPRFLVWYVVGHWISQWRRDIDIWENKIYLERPRLCREDGPVLRARHWYRQFIPDHAPGGEGSPGAEVLPLRIAPDG